MTAYSIEIPIRTVNTLNGAQFGRVAWGKVARRKKERAITRLVCLADLCAIEGIGAVDRVVFTRIAPRPLDNDGLAASCKSIRDELAAFLGVSDAPSGGVDWRYDQQRGPPKHYAVRISIEVHESGAPDVDAHQVQVGLDATEAPTSVALADPLGRGTGAPGCVRGSRARGVSRRR